LVRRNDAVSATCTVVTNRAAVWDALILTEHREQWWPGFEITAHVGGTIDESWRDGAGALHHTRGTVLQIDEQATLEFEWIDEDWRQPSVVRILIDDSVDGTRITVTEHGLAEASEDPAVFSDHQRGWEMHLSDLAAFVTGRE
jgi:uncharacterized protein YndB with AHSA1/START domain